MTGHVVSAPRGRSGFTLIELLLVIAIVALLVSIILPSLGQARKTARLSQGLTNLKQFATAATSYSGEFRELVPTFSWRAGQPAGGVDFSDPLGPGAPVNQNPVSIGNDVDAAAAQAGWIIAKKATPTVPGFDDGANWFPHVRYSHLVLTDFLSTALPGPGITSPFDWMRQRFQEAYRQSGGGNTGMANAWATLGTDVHGGRGDTRRAIFSSSYQTSASALIPDFYPSNTIGLRNATAEGAINAFSSSLNASYRLGGRKWTDVRFPASKIWMFEDVSWHVDARVTFHYTNPRSTTTVATFDGSARLLRYNEGARGGYMTLANRNSPTSRPQAANALWKSPEGSPGDSGGGGNSAIGVPYWVGPWPYGVPAELNVMHRFTVGGLSGVDIGKPLREPAAQ